MIMRDQIFDELDTLCDEFERNKIVDADFKELIHKINTHPKIGTTQNIIDMEKIRWKLLGNCNSHVFILAFNTHDE